MAAEKMVFSVSIQMSNGPKVAVESSLIADAYGKFSAVISAGATDVKVALPWGSGGAASFLIVKPTQSSERLVYKVNDKASVIEYELDGPHVLLGKGAMKLMDPSPANLYFTNKGSEDMAVEILIGGDATPGT